MSKNNKFLLVISLLIIYILVNYFLPLGSLFGYKWYGSQILFLGIFYVSKKLLPKKGSKRDIDTKTKTVLILTIFYIIIFLLFGLIIEFERNIFWGKFLFGVETFIQVASIFIIQELIRERLVNNVPKNKWYFYILIVIVYFVMALNFRKLSFNSSDFASTLEFVLSIIAVPLAKQITLTYMMSKSGKKAVFVYLLLIQLMTNFSPVFPNMDWFLFAMFDIVWFVIFCLVINYEAVSLDREIRRGVAKKENPVVYLILLSLLIIFVCFQIGLFTYAPVAIVTNSMYPLFSRGDAVIIEKVTEENVKNLEINDIIQYKMGNEYVVHRIVAIDKMDENAWQFITKGDHNNGDDAEPVTEEQIEGLVHFSIPFIGYPSVYFIEMFNKSSNPGVETGD